MRSVLTLSMLIVGAFGAGFAVNQYSLERGNVAARTLSAAASGVLAQYDYYDSTETHFGNTYWTPSYYYQSAYESYYVTSPYDPVDDYGIYWHDDDFDDDYPDYYEEYETIYVRPDPWYVTTFPGIGRMAQYMIPGQINPVPVRITAPVPTPTRPVHPQPSCWIAADPTQIAYGGTSVLSWSSFNADRATLSNVGDIQTSGSRTLRGLSSTATYTLQVSGPGGSNLCYTRINVASAEPPPSCYISLFPDTIARGQTAALSWGSMNATVATLGGVGVVPLQDGRTVYPAYASIYTLTVSNGSGQQATCSARLNVM